MTLRVPTQADIDPIGLGGTMARLGVGLVRRPLPVLAGLSRYGGGLAHTALATAGRSVGMNTSGPIPVSGQDRRFADPAWAQNPRFFATLQSYRLFERLVADIIAAAELREPYAAKARFVGRMVVEAAAPTNVLPGNPAALKRAFDTGGKSLVRGARNMASDVVTNDGLPRKVDRAAFTVGENLAVTDGQVVFRNDLIELLQYEPRTPASHEIPLLLSPPWINKYYIMDLAPGRSFAQWALDHGHTVFAISYRNPDRSMSKIALDDYLLSGPLAALEVIENITGSPKVNIAALCLGGSLTAMLLAHLAATGSERVNSVTLLNTLLDFSEPGELGAFADAASVARIEAKMTRTGFLDAKDMARTFDLMRANDLIWGYVSSRWLMGEELAAFDILAWNEDSTRMPAAMHSTYLRSCYVENRLARGEMTLAGVDLDLGKVAADAYVLAAKEDHIAPWTAAYRSTQLLAGENRFVLSSAGHIAGIVNPPGPKAKHWTGADLPADPQQWLAGATEHRGSWWEDWATWIGTRAGGTGAPPPMGSDRYPALCPAPGTYVLGT
ncbi:MAG: PHA/PHB synthase family protein [Sporichthyaceae bacterium]